MITAWCFLVLLGGKTMPLQDDVQVRNLAEPFEAKLGQKMRRDEILCFGVRLEAVLGRWR